VWYWVSAAFSIARIHCHILPFSHRPINSGMIRDFLHSACWLCCIVFQLIRQQNNGARDCLVYGRIGTRCADMTASSVLKQSCRFFTNQINSMIGHLGIHSELRTAHWPQPLLAAYYYQPYTRLQLPSSQHYIDPWLYITMTKPETQVSGPELFEACHIYCAPETSSRGHFGIRMRAETS
jgi:hypothetical protein